MTKLNPIVCIKIKEARRSQGLSQSELAAEVGCKQSALSMFEQGDGTKLNDAVVERLAKKFGIDLEKTGQSANREGVSEASVSEFRSLPSVAGFCPNPQCPTNRPYKVGGRECYRPDRSAADPVGGRFCAMCGEVLEKKCPSCGAAVHDGAFCSLCGAPYVSA
ncbi:MAG: helix-turn-helix domain-containing protein [Kiritimatiellae bacterium]|nr:helix-turn-helix domain-containing protein [Kiritimatiellia bacterium]